MDMFPKIAKTILIVLIGLIVYSLINDIGRMYVTDSQNGFIARNASSYTSKFTVDEKKLLEFKEYSITSADANKALKDYFDMQYTNLGYTLESSTSGDKMKLVYVPSDRRTADGEYENLGPIYVRIIQEGFDGGTSRLGDAGVGLVIINIEQKVPSGLRNFMKTLGTSDVVDDNEGFWGYYSVEQNYAFTMNVLRKAY